MRVLPTIEDLPKDKPNCYTCTRTDSLCEREKHGAKNGYLHGVSGEVTGMISGCIHYQGAYRQEGGTQ